MPSDYRAASKDKEGRCALAHSNPLAMNDEVAENSGRKDFSIEPWFHGGYSDHHLNGAFCSERAAEMGLGQLILAERFAVNHLPTARLLDDGSDWHSMGFAT
ncbi:hypothetical protein QR685DRAFT_538407 [Neurospora intermedia]|uniref:Uncharacterized protein n=1 Tax=Neurospora intermedia TaxID=5142 RepID=A0ABR3CYZ6_NEUIN